MESGRKRIGEKIIFYQTKKTRMSFSDNWHELYQDKERNANIIGLEVITSYE